MEEKDFKELMTKINADAKPFVEGLVKAAMEGTINTEKLNDELSHFVKMEVVEQLTKAVEKQGLEMHKIFEQHKPDKTLNDLLHENKDAFLKLKENQNGSIKIEVPYSMIQKTDVTRSSVGSHTLAFREPGIGQLAHKRITLEQLFPVINVGAGTNGVVRYVDQASVTRSAAEKAEASAYAESVITWTEFSLNLQKITDSIPVTKEALNDINWINGEINNFMTTNILLKEDQQLYDGDGSPPNLKGVYTYSDAYTAVASGITDANVFDLLVKIKGNISANTQFMPNFALLNNQEINLMLLKKDSHNNYVRPDFVTINADGSFNVAGMRVIETPVVATDTLQVGDSNFGTIYRIDNLVLEFGFVNDDFIKDLITLKASKRENLLIRTVNTGAFNKETGVAAALATLAT